jgi:hypothetical protein
MHPYVLSVVLLSGAAFIHRMSAVPELRPTGAAADHAWRLLGKASFLAWLGMLVWGVLRVGLLLTLAAFLLSLGLNALIAMGGPRASWPALSVLFALAGLGLAGAIVLGWVQS